MVLPPLVVIMVHYLPCFMTMGVIAAAPKKKFAAAPKTVKAGAPKKIKIFGSNSLWFLWYV